jgi:hypothetical protein
MGRNVISVQCYERYQRVERGEGTFIYAIVPGNDACCGEEKKERLLKTKKPPRLVRGSSREIEFVVLSSDGIRFRLFRILGSNGLTVGVHWNWNWMVRLRI